MVMESIQEEIKIGIEMIVRGEGIQRHLPRDQEGNNKTLIGDMNINQIGKKTRREMVLVMTRIVSEGVVMFTNNHLSLLLFLLLRFLPLHHHLIM